MVDCLLVTANTEHGYKRVWRSGKMVYLHREVLEQKLGRKLQASEVARHLCHTRNCINPNHLDVGTQYDNVQDCIKAGRARYVASRGEHHGRARIDEETAKRAIQLLKQHPIKDVADQLQCSYHIVAQISSSRTWKHLPR